MNRDHFPIQERVAIAAIIALCVVCLSLLSRSAQAALPTVPGPEAYPRALQPILVKRGLEIVQVRPLKTVLTLSKRKAVADRLIVVFRNSLADADQDSSHLRANRLGAGKALPLVKSARRRSWSTSPAQNRWKTRRALTRPIRTCCMLVPIGSCTRVRRRTIHSLAARVALTRSRHPPRGTAPMARRAW